MLSLKHQVVQLALILASISCSDGAKMNPGRLTRNRKGVRGTPPTGNLVKNLSGERRLQDDSTFFDVKGITENEPKSISQPPSSSPSRSPSSSPSPSAGKGHPDHKVPKKTRAPSSYDGRIAASDAAPSDVPFTISVPIGSPTSLPVDSTIPSTDTPSFDSQVGSTVPTPTPTSLQAGTSGKRVISWLIMQSCFNTNHASSPHESHVPG